MFLFEIFSEEVPARMQAGSVVQIKDMAKQYLHDEKLPYQDINAYVTPRRLSLIIDGIASHQSVSTVTKKGPANDDALARFARALGLQESDCVKRDGFWFAEFTPIAKKAEDVLKALSEHILAHFVWQKKMRWGAGASTWIRPIRSLVCLYNDKIIPIEFDGIKSGRMTHGHRLSAGEITINDIGKYESYLKDHFVILDQSQRRDHIKTQVTKISADIGCFIKESDEVLFDEVTGLTEWPVAILGKFDKKFLDMPEELLTTSIKNHQKSFPIYYKDSGSLAEYFIVISNFPNPTDAIREGYERVILARLSDAMFFWNDDRKKSLEEYNENLKDRMFFRDIGSMHDKVQRLVELSKFYGSKDLERAALLSKADLETGAVEEFPELQGIMGKYYACDDTKEIRKAIEEHYWPQGEQNLDKIRLQSELGRMLGIIDRIDTLVGFFGIHEIPTGSRDPYALRRAAYGLIRLLIMDDGNISIAKLIEESISAYNKQGMLRGYASMEKLIDFCNDRLVHVLRDDGVDSKFINAAIKSQHYAGSIKEEYERAHSLVKMFESSCAKEFLLSYKRICSIISKERYHAPSDKFLFQTDEERNLHKMIHAELNYDFAKWARVINEFFDNVHIACPIYKENRIKLLFDVKHFFDKIVHLESLI